MGEQLTEDEITKIVWALNNWPISEKLEWELFRESLPALFPEREDIPTRQALHRHHRIYQAFKDRKDVCGKGGKYGDKDPELRDALLERDKLKDENQRLMRQVSILQEQINREAYNTFLGKEKGAPIRKIDRRPTKVGPGMV